MSPGCSWTLVLGPVWLLNQLLTHPVPWQRVQPPPACFPAGSKLWHWCGWAPLVCETLPSTLESGVQQKGRGGFGPCWPWWVLKCCGSCRLGRGLCGGGWVAEGWAALSLSLGAFPLCTTGLILPSFTPAPELQSSCHLCRLRTQPRAF